MDSDYIVSHMHTHLHTASIVLSEWLGTLLPRASEDWWEECVINNLSYNQREVARAKGYTKLEDFDLASLLRIADKSWYTMRQVALPSRKRMYTGYDACVRNNWAHCGANLPGKDSMLQDLNTLHIFFEQRECDERLMNEIEHLIEEVKSPLTVDFVSFTQPEDMNIMEETPENTGEFEIQEKGLVYLIGDPSVRGIVMSITNLGDTLSMRYLLMEILIPIILGRCLLSLKPHLIIG